MKPISKTLILTVLTYFSCQLSAFSTELAANDTCYFQDVETGLFLSRGADDGVRATLDRMGVPVEVIVNSTKKQYSLHMIDIAGKYLGYNANSENPFVNTNVSNNSYTKWIVDEVETSPVNSYILKNVFLKQWLCLETGNLIFTADSLKAIKFRVLSRDEYETSIAPKTPDYPCFRIDMTRLVKNPDMTQGLEGWTFGFSTVSTNSYGINEVFQGYGTLSQSIEKMPVGMYEVSVQGFYRDGTNAYCAQYANKGYRMSNAYLLVNGSAARIADWASDRANNANPNNMQEAAALFAKGKYKTTVYAPLVQSTTPLNISLVQPNYMSYGWFAWSGVNVTYLAKANPSDPDNIDKSEEAKQAYSVLLKKCVEDLQNIVDTRPALTDEMRQECNDAITRANGATSATQMKNAVEELDSLYDVCSTFRRDVDRSGDPYTSYLFVYFPSNQNENLYYAISEDGFNYTPLNDGNRVMASDTVALKKGIRDPHIIRGNDGYYYMVATDMKCSQGWDSNRGIVMYRSKDLVNWSHSTVNFPTRFPEWSTVKRVWAPETIWDPEYVNTDGSKGRFMIYFSLRTNDAKCPYDRVYYCYANDDFTELISDPVFLFDRGDATIDGDIVFDETDMLYHMIYKQEGSTGIYQVTSQTLTAPSGTQPGSQWSMPRGPLEQTKVAVEGGGLYRLIKSNTWVLMYDCFNDGIYQFCTTDDWKNFTLKAKTTTTGKFTPRHGAVLPLTREETGRVVAAFPTNGLILDIEKVNSQQSTVNRKIYNILGQKTLHPAKGEIYIQDGKKKIMK